MDAWKERARKDLGRRISLALHRIGMTQTELARQVGTGHARVNRWINQGVMPEGKSLVLLPKILQCDGHWLLTGEGSPNPGPDTPDQIEIRKLVDQLCAAVRR